MPTRGIHHGTCGYSMQPHVPGLHTAHASGLSPNSFRAPFNTHVCVLGPQEADWEHENEVQDDDEDIGVANEEYDDDAHMRKKLGECVGTTPCKMDGWACWCAAAVPFLVLYGHTCWSCSETTPQTHSGDALRTHSCSAPVDSAAPITDMRCFTAGLDQEEEEERPAPGEDDAPDPAAAAKAAAQAAAADANAAAAGGADLVVDEMEDSDEYDLSDAEEMDLDDLDAMATVREGKKRRLARG